MNRRAAFGIVMGLSLLGTTRWNVAGAFTSLQIVSVTASVTMGGSSISTSTLRITALPLPSEAFFGKNVVIPVQVINPTGAINPTNLSVNIVYQLFDVNGVALTPTNKIPVSFQQRLGDASELDGAAIIPVSNLSPIENGGSLSYIFLAQQEGSGVILTHGGSAPAPPNVNTLPTPFQTSILTTPLCSAVGPAGAHVIAPDLSESDGKTGVSLNPGAVTTPGTLCIEQENPQTTPASPGGSLAAAVYSITLNNTSLVQTAQLDLSYPADPNGTVTGANYNGADLAIYYLQPNGIWRLLGLPQVDTTLHLVSGVTTHFTTFALLPAGSMSAADLRPQERIITPNGDGINDTATFSGVDGAVHIFDVRGRRVRTLNGTSPVWDGRDDNGAIVPSGVYIYQYSVNGERVSGVIGVAK